MSYSRVTNITCIILSRLKIQIVVLSNKEWGVFSLRRLNLEMSKDGYSMLQHGHSTHLKFHQINLFKAMLHISTPPASLLQMIKNGNARLWEWFSMTFIALKLRNYVQVMKLLFGVTDPMAKPMFGSDNHHRIISHFKDQLIPLQMQAVVTGKKLKKNIPTTLMFNQCLLTRLTSWFWWQEDSYCFSCYLSAAVFAVVYAREEEKRKRKSSKLKQRWQEPRRDVSMSSIKLTGWLEKIDLLDYDIYFKDPVRKVFALIISWHNF